MERLNWHLANGLSQHAQVTIIGPEQSVHQAPSGIQFIGVPLKPLWGFIISTFIKSIWFSIKHNPKIVLAGSGLTTPMALISAKLSGGTSVVYLHGLDIVVNHPLYRAFWLPAIRRMDKVIVNSSYSAKLAQAIGISDNKISIIHPGVSVPTASVSKEKISMFRTHQKLGQSRLILSVGRLTERKGIREFVQQCLPQIVAAIPDAILVIIGDEPKDSLYAKKQSIKSIKAAAQKAGLIDHIRFLGWIAMEDDTFQTAFYASSVHIFPVKNSDNDPEGFGMVAVEAAAHGLPTVAFATGGIVDSVTDKSGYLVTPGDYADLAQKITYLLQNPGSLHTSCQEFAAKFEWKNFSREIYTELFTASER